MVMNMNEKGELRKCIDELEDRYDVYVSRSEITNEFVSYKIYDRILKKSDAVCIKFDDIRTKKDAIGYILSYISALCLKCEYERKKEFNKNGEYYHD